MSELYIGLMSGTSNDGIDAVVLDLSRQGFKLLGTHYQSYPNEIKAQLKKIITQQNVLLAEFSELDHKLAVLNTLAVRKLLQSNNIAIETINAIGYHGQTIYHDPEIEVANSIQIGDPNFLAAHTQTPVIADFRRMDMAMAGQGAPLVPAFHQYLFQKNEIHRAILNIGGIANVTILPADKDKEIYGFDTGPGNALLDDWNQQHNKSDYDHAGHWAAKGNCVEDLLARLFSDPYFAQRPPKSTGREYFNLNWLQQFNLTPYSSQDIQSTLTVLTAHSIAQAIAEHAPRTQQVFVCGGGIKNEFLIKQIKTTLGTIETASTKQLGLDPDWVEASAFAWLAQQRMQEKPGNLTSVTGATSSVLLGAIYKK